MALDSAVFAGLTVVTHTETDRETDRPTDRSTAHATPFVATDRIYLGSTAMRPKMMIWAISLVPPQKNCSTTFRACNDLQETTSRVSAI